MSPKPIDRDFIGYGASPPDPEWPGEARLALNFVMNYEEGSEYTFAQDGRSEAVLSEVPGGYTGLLTRDRATESILRIRQSRLLALDAPVLHVSDAAHDHGLRASA
jgi:hypothetical protein